MKVAIFTSILVCMIAVLAAITINPGHKLNYNPKPELIVSKF